MASKKYTTKIKLNNKRPRTRTKTRRNYVHTKLHKRQQRQNRKHKLVQRLIKGVFVTTVLIFSILLISALYLMSYLDELTADLPSPDKPFGKKNLASEFYDRDGNLLYRLFNEENRDPVKMSEVPPLLKWTFLAAEDIDFYEHPGIDLPGVLRCSYRLLVNDPNYCGASTITQQLIKQTALTNERKLERKLKEMILAIQVENKHSKDDILEMYFTVVPEGSNIYSITSASKFYFGKELQELNLAEMAILAAIPQNPSQLSPTRSANPEQAQKKVKARQEYVLDQMEKYLDKINSRLMQETSSSEPVLTLEMISEARKFELVYKNPTFPIEAPHFVFYAQKQLQTKGYNNGNPFTLADLETGGYKIWTTLRSDWQSVAEEQVAKGVNVYGSSYGADNAAMVVLNPNNGEVLALVGSKDYFGNATPEGCTYGINCKFEPNVNITDTLQSYGSSLKPMVYYLAIMNGIINPGSQLADIPIKLGDYQPKNYEGGFTGIHSARWMLAQSRNIPAIYLVDQLGVTNFVDEMRRWGYSTFTNPSGYGPSIAVGGGDVKLIEHAQGYGILANEGKLVPHEVILRIEDREGNVIYEYQPQETQVADPRGVYLVNHMLNGRNDGPGLSWDGRDVSAKTGTSESQRETLYITYTPEVVVAAWLGNNNNAPMRYGASGFTSARPWSSEFLIRVGDQIPATPFSQPPGVTWANGDLTIDGINTPSYVYFKTALVCSDQPDRLARPIDINLGMTKTLNFVYYLMPNAKLQPFLDSWQSWKSTYPTQYCNVPRNTNIQESN